MDITHQWEDFEDSNYSLLQKRYADREALGNEWLEKRKIADKNRTKEDGSPNPAYPRLAMEEQIARMAYDLSYVLAANNVMQQQVEMFSTMFQRMAVLEGAYSHLMTAQQNTKQEYMNRLQRMTKARREAMAATKSLDSNPSTGDNKS